jgi:hypothetical protein
MATLTNTIVDDTGFVALPFGTTAQRPASPVNGDTRFNTDFGYVEYYFMGFWINAENNRGGIPMQGLLCLLDIDNLASYPGTGTTITDLSGNGRNGTITGTVTYGTLSTGSRFLSGGTSAYVTIPINVNALTNRFTVLTVAGYNGATRRRITTSTGNNWLLGHWGDGDARYFAEGWVNQETSSGTGASLNQWGVHVGTGDASSINTVTYDEWQYWKNGGLKTASGITGGSAGPAGSIIINQFNSESSDWKWQMLAVWNRVLSGDEIQEMTANIRIRGGI